MLVGHPLGARLRPGHHRAVGGQPARRLLPTRGARQGVLDPAGDAARRRRHRRRPRRLSRHASSAGAGPRDRGDPRPARGLLVFRMREPKRGTADLMAAIGGGQIEHAEDGRSRPVRARLPPVREGHGRRAARRHAHDPQHPHDALRAASASPRCCSPITAIAAWLPQYYERQLHFGRGQGEAMFMGCSSSSAACPACSSADGSPTGGRPKMQGGRLALPAIFLFIGTVLLHRLLPVPARRRLLELDWRSPVRPSSCSSLGVFVMTMAIPGLRAGLTDAIPAHLRGAGFGAFNLVAVVCGQAAAPLIVGAISGAFDENLRIAFLAVTPLSFIGAAHPLPGPQVPRRGHEQDHDGRPPGPPGREGAGGGDRPLSSSVPRPELGSAAGGALRRRRPAGSRLAARGSALVEHQARSRAPR